MGPQWIGASRIFALLGIVGLVQPIANTTGWLFMTQGRTHHMFQWGLISASMIVASIIVGLPWGAIGVAASYSSTFLLVITPLLFWFVGRHGPVRTGDFYRTVAPVASGALCVLVVLLTLRRWMTVTRPLIGLVISFAITVVISLLVLSLSPKGRMALRDFKQASALLARKRESKVAILSDSHTANSSIAV